jgi:predicted  nucleic acid-binding Zn-ribbon protein
MKSSTKLECELKLNEYIKKISEAKEMESRLIVVQKKKAEMSSLDPSNKEETDSMSVSETSKRSSKSSRSKRTEKAKSVKKAKPGSRNEEIYLVQGLNLMRESVEELSSFVSRQIGRAVYAFRNVWSAFIFRRIKD